MGMVNAVLLLKLRKCDDRLTRLVDIVDFSEVVDVVEQHCYLDNCREHDIIYIPVNLLQNTKAAASSEI